MKFEELIKDKEITVPAYQRPFAWKNKLIGLFLDDLRNCVEKNIDYYYGHFILEKAGGKYEVVDGQQRLTLAVLFILYCHKAKSMEISPEFLSFAQRFETVNYDQELYSKEIKEKIGDIKHIKKIADPKDKSKTLSIKRLAEALMEIEENLKKTKPEDLKAMLVKLAKSEVSIHETDTKAVAVQIFELSNTRGIRINTIEKVKAKLMQFVYEKGGEKCEEYVKEVQEHFACIYKMEQNLAAQSFRGDLALDELFFYHLRMVDDGRKVEFEKPGGGYNEQAIMNYLKERLKKVETEYVLSLSEKFKESVRIFTEKLPKIDKDNNFLAGDVLILDKAKSTEFFLLICHNSSEEINEKQLRLWEQLLFTRDFHDKYYRKRYKDDFPELYKELRNALKENKSIDTVLESYVQNGFRDDTAGLQDIVYNHVFKYQKHILRGGYYFWTVKMHYLLYKYEKNCDADLEKLRSVIKEGEHLEHILPSEWSWEWIEKNYPDQEEQQKFNEEISQCINGIGNLLLISRSENSSLSNKHPAEKRYKIPGGSYKIHNKNREKWREPKQWHSLIEERGEQILEFLFSYFFSKERENAEYCQQLRNNLDHFKLSEIQLNFSPNWDSLYYYFDLGLPALDNDKTHIRIVLFLTQEINMQAEFQWDRIAGNNKEKKEEIQNIIQKFMGIDGEWSSIIYTEYPPFQQMDSFIENLNKVIEELKDRGFKPLPVE